MNIKFMDICKFMLIYANFIGPSSAIADYYVWWGGGLMCIVNMDSAIGNRQLAKIDNIYTFDIEWGMCGERGNSASRLLVNIYCV